MSSVSRLRQDKAVYRGRGGVRGRVQAHATPVSRFVLVVVLVIYRHLKDEHFHPGENRKLFLTRYTFCVVTKSKISEFFDSFFASERLQSQLVFQKTLPPKKAIWANPQDFIGREPESAVVNPTLPGSEGTN
jgi:hypothetical protein